MGSFHTTAIVMNPLDRGRRFEVPHLLVDTGSEYTWVGREQLESIGIVPESKNRSFLLADGRTVTRRIGFAILLVGDEFTNDEVVMAEPGDLLLLGAHSLEGLNLRIDPIRKCLISAGSVPAACA